MSAAQALGATPFFASLSPVDLARLVPELEECAINAGDVVFRQGEPGDGLYLIRSGAAGVSIADASGSRIVAVLEPPAYFGEMALLSDEPRTATIIALRPLALWKLPSDRFEALIGRYPRVLQQVATELARRLNQTTRRLAASEQAVSTMASVAYAALDPTTQALLCELAVVPSFDASQARELAGAAADDATLAWLCQEGGFLRQDPSDGRYALAYPSLRQFLLERLEAQIGPAGLEARRRRGNRVASDTPALTSDEPTPAVEPKPAEIAAEPSAFTRKPRLSPRWIVALIVVGVTGLIWLLPPPLGLSVAGLRVLSGIVALLALGFLGLLPDYQLGLLMLAAWVLAGVVPGRVATAGFATSTWFLLLAAMSIGVAVARSGLLYRVALEAVRRLPPSHAVRCAALVAFGTAFSPGMSSTSGRLTLSAPLAQDIAESLHFPPRSSGSAALGLAAYLGFGQLGSLFMTGSAPALVVYGLLPAETQAEMSFGHWFVAALPAHLIIGAIALAFLVWRYQPESGGYVSATTLAIQRGVLGGLSRQEWAAGLVTGLLLLCFLTQPLHGLNPAWLAVLAVAALFLLGALDEPSLRSGVNWGLLLYLGIVMGFGAVFSHVGLDQWLAVNLDGLTNLVGDNPGLFVLLTALIGGVVGVVLRAGPSSVVVSLALFPVAASIGVSPWIVGMIFLLTTTQFLFPQQSFYYLTAYYAAGEKSFSHAQARPVAIVYGLATLLAIAASIPFWRWLGLLG